MLMTSLLRLAFFLIGFAATQAFAAGTGEAVPQESLDQASAQAARFLCHESFCLPNPVPVRMDGRTNGFLAYYHSKEKRISLAPEIDHIVIQLHLVHESTHAYRDLFQSNEQTWLYEGLAQLMEYRYSNVWPVDYIDRFQKRPEIRLSNHKEDYAPNGNGYASSFLLVHYIYQHFGGDRLLKKMLESKNTGWENVLGSIKELRTERHLSIEDEFVTKDAILRHFAVALWLNDPFAADYSLFAIDRQYEALSKTKLGRDISLEGVQINRKGGEARIVFNRRSQKSAASEAYAIRSHKPLKIEAAQGPGAADVFISIFY